MKERPKCTLQEKTTKAISDPVLCYFSLYPISHRKNDGTLTDVGVPFERDVNSVIQIALAAFSWLG